MQKSFYLVAIVIAIFVLFVGSAAYVKNKSASNEPLPTAEITATDWKKGTESKVTLLEYADFQCPACGQYYPLVEEVLKDVGGSITYVYRHMPLNQHINAVPAALAAEAAGKQGKFWEMYTQLFTHQVDWSESKDPFTIFSGYAKALGLDMDQFTTTYNDPLVKAKITDSYKAGIKLGVEGTPTFFLNGKKIVTPRSKEEFESIINDALKTAGVTTTATTQ
jgi:protein-disulfide isomerase